MASTFPARISPLPLPLPLRAIADFSAPVSEAAMEADLCLELALLAKLSVSPALLDGEGSCHVDDELRSKTSVQLALLACLGTTSRQQRGLSQPLRLLKINAAEAVRCGIISDCKFVLAYILHSLTIHTKRSPPTLLPFSAHFNTAIGKKCKPFDYL